jgi:hypothetical protein
MRGISFAILSVQLITVFDHFKILTQERQLDLIMKKGIFLTSYSQYNVIIRLFQLQDFYVEIYSFDEDGKIAMINAFRDLKYLDPYLERLDVSELISG